MAQHLKERCKNITSSGQRTLVRCRVPQKWENGICFSRCYPKHEDGSNWFFGNVGVYLQD